MNCAGPAAATPWSPCASAAARALPPCSSGHDTVLMRKRRGGRWPLRRSDHRGTASRRTVMGGAGRAWAAGEDAMAAVAPEGGLFARLDPVSFGSSLLAVAGRAALHPYAASGAFWQFAATLAGIGPEAVARWTSRGGDDDSGPGAAALAKDKRFADRTWRDNPAFF